MRNGANHKPTMELMDFWLTEKDLIHRLFNVYVPRYARFEAPYTKAWYIPSKSFGQEHKAYGHGGKKMLLELKGNPYPPVEPRHLDNKQSLANILLAEAKRDYVRQKIRAAESTNVPDQS